PELCAALPALPPGDPDVPLPVVPDDTLAPEPAFPAPEPLPTDDLPLAATAPPLAVDPLFAPEPLPGGESDEEQPPAELPTATARTPSTKAKVERMVFIRHSLRGCG
ncbi:MAG: hypothetical protein M3O36_06535, partial [Myxococcota bacterium]|nr:hypothetical protein [Myxococcota bacterium]